MRWLCLRWAGKHAGVLELGRSPDWFLIAVVELLLDHLGEVFPRSVEFGNVVARRTLPETLARLLLGPLADAVVKLVVVASEAEVHLPVPVEVVLGTGLREPLESEMGTAVDRVHIGLCVVVDVVGERLGVVHAHLLLGPERRHAPEFPGQILLNDLLVDLLRRPDGKAGVLDMQQEVDVVLAARLDGELVDHGADGQNLVVAILVAGPGAQDVRVAGHLRLDRLLIGAGSILLETDFVLLVASLLSCGPANVAVVDLLLPVPDLVGTSLFRLGRHLEAALVAGVGVAVGSKATETVEAHLVIQTDLLVRAEHGRGHVLGDTRVRVNVGGADLLGCVEVACLDLVVGLEVGVGVVLVGLEGDGVERGLLVVLGHVRPLGLDVVLRVGRLRVLDIVLLRHPVAERY